MHVNKTGFQVTYTNEKGEPRTYACTDWQALDHLVTRLTRQPLGPTPFSYEDLPGHRAGFTINTDFHIYGAQGLEVQIPESGGGR